MYHVQTFAESKNSFETSLGCHTVGRSVQNTFDTLDVSAGNSVTTWSALGQGPNLLFRCFI